jgi:hypothetical protein
MSAPIVSARRTAVVMLTLPLLGGLAACSTGGQKLTRSGFLPDYSAMGPTKQHKKDAIFVAADYAPGAYDKVVVEPVEWLAPTRSDETKEKLKADFRSRLVRSFGTKYRVVDASEAGPGTLRIRSAITGTRPARWYLNVPAQAAQLALGGIGLFRPSSGGASEEMQIQDAVTGRPLVQVATFRNGKPWHVSGSYVPYDHARGAFTDASKLLMEVATAPEASRSGAPRTEVASVNH